MKTKKQNNVIRKHPLKRRLDLKFQQFFFTEKIIGIPFLIEKHSQNLHAKLTCVD